MNEQLKRLGLTQLARVLPTLLDEARQQQLSYEAFLRQAVDAELGGRQQRALERRLRAAPFSAPGGPPRLDFFFPPPLFFGPLPGVGTLSFFGIPPNGVVLEPPGGRAKPPAR